MTQEEPKPVIQPMFAQYELSLAFVQWEYTIRQHARICNATEEPPVGLGGWRIVEERDVGGVSFRCRTCGLRIELSMVRTRVDSNLYAPSHLLTYPIPIIQFVVLYEEPLKPR